MAIWHNKGAGHCLPVPLSKKPENHQERNQGRQDEQRGQLYRVNVSWVGAVTEEMFSLGKGGLKPCVREH